MVYGRKEESASWPKKERTGPTLKGEALDNHSTVSRVPAQKYSPGKEERKKEEKKKKKKKKTESRRKRLSDLFPFQRANSGERSDSEKGKRSSCGSFMF